MKATSPTDWIGSLAVDKDGNQLGEIRSILNDDETQKPEWAVVSTGFLGADKPVPLAGARPEGDKVWANVTKDQVKSAPDVQDVTHLTPDEEVSLFDHYGVPYGGDTVTSTGDPTASGKGQSTGRMPLHEEELTAKKQSVQRGEARIGKEVVTEQKQIDVPVMHEEPYIERQPVAKRPAESEIGQGEIKVPIMAEQASAEKRPVVKEEVRLGKRPVEETQQVSETVRREEPTLEGGPISEAISEPDTEP
ncbi:MAG: YsnF/AvaK domain-containing protein [Chloroflexi bacterium]|nr:MAG: YsnF/AvaK domain-containing protein [Chloroflexota bacterium]